MPAVLTVSSYTESGHVYDDQLGKYYSFPERYCSIVVPGETVVFYTGTRNYPETQPTSYLGVAMVGRIEPTQQKTPKGEQIFRCMFHGFQRFPNDVRFKGGNTYFEEGANRHGRPSLYFSQGVRRISVSELFTIVQHSGL